MTAATAAVSAVPMPTTPCHVCCRHIALQGLPQDPCSCSEHTSCVWREQQGQAVSPEHQQGPSGQPAGSESTQQCAAQQQSHEQHYRCTRSEPNVQPSSQTVEQCCRSGSNRHQACREHRQRNSSRCTQEPRALLPYARPTDCTSSAAAATAAAA
jgi:hypothetical protein